MNLDTSKIVDIELDGLDFHDWPDLCDAYMAEAWLEIPREEANKLNINPCRNGKYYRELNEDELDWLSEHETDWYWGYIYKHAADYFVR